MKNPHTNPEAPKFVRITPDGHLRLPREALPDETRVWSGRRPWGQGAGLIML